jgi:hypothetical protein
VTPSDFKKAREELKILEKTRQELNLKESDLSKEIAHNQAKIIKISQDLKMARIIPNVSEHAKVRYCERVLSINMQEVEDAILDEKVIEQINTIENGKIPKGDFIIIVEDKTVKTIVTKEMIDARNPRKKKG